MIPSAAPVSPCLVWPAGIACAGSCPRLGCLAAAHHQAQREAAISSMILMSGSITPERWEPSSLDLTRRTRPRESVTADGGSNLLLQVLALLDLPR